MSKAKIAPGQRGLRSHNPDPRYCWKQPPADLRDRPDTIARATARRCRGMRRRPCARPPACRCRCSAYCLRDRRQSLARNASAERGPPQVPHHLRVGAELDVERQIGRADNRAESSRSVDGKDLAHGAGPRSEQALPTRTCVAPIAMAVSKSALIPIDSTLAPDLARPAPPSARNTVPAARPPAECAIRPSIASPCTSRQRSTNATASSGANAGLLRLEPDIDLDQQPRLLAGPLHLRLERDGDLLAVDRLDHVEQRHRLARLVGLQRPDQMQFYAVIGSPERGPFGLRLLHPVLAEHPLAGVEERAHLVGGEGLATRPPAPPAPAAGRSGGAPARCGRGSSSSRSAASSIALPVDRF